MIPHQPPCERVRHHERRPDDRSAEDGASEDVEHVVSVVGEGEGVDEGVVADGEKGGEGGKEDVWDVDERAAAGS